jgi:hypothetical protein
MMRIDDPNLPEPAEEEVFREALGNLDRLIGDVCAIEDEAPDSFERWERTTAELQRSLVCAYGALKKLQRVQ